MRRGGGVSLVDRRSGYRRLFVTAREAARAAVTLTTATAGQSRPRKATYAASRLLDREG
jgi:hypothetical protein